MKSSVLTLVMLLSTSSSSLYALTSPLPVITQGTLSNGLKYTLVPLSGQKQRVDIRLMVNAGSLNEASDQLGAAHMLEHMLFHQSEKFPKGIAKTLQGAGWIRGRNYNAVTNHERTMYMLSPPHGSRDTDLSLQVLSQMVAAPRFDEKALDTERPIILEEWRGKLGVAERMNQQRMQALREGSLYPERPVIGTESSIRSTPLSTIYHFHSKWYRPQNMQLMLIGDVDQKQVIPKLERYFGQIPVKSNIAVESYDPKLRPQLRIIQLYDSESGSSQLSYVYRLDDRRSKPDGKQGMRERLIDQIATTALTQQIKRQVEHLPPYTTNMVMRKADIGQHTTAVGFFMDVLPDYHNQALSVLLEEIARIQQYGLQSSDIDRITVDITATAKRMQQQPEQREFEEWVQKLTQSWQQGRTYTGSLRVAQDAIEILPTITSNEVNKRIQEWLSAPDQLLQYSVPGNSKYDLPTVSQVRELQKKLTQQDLTAPQARVVTQPSELPPVLKTGTIVGINQNQAQQIEEWTLSNGDRIVWLKTPLAQDKIYFTAQSSAGYFAEGLTPWQTQIASQIIGQTGPRGWQANEYNQWKAQHKISINISQNANEMLITGQSQAKDMMQLLHLYHALQQPSIIEPQALKSTIAGLMRRQAHNISSVSGLREKETQKLRFDSLASLEPSQQQLSQVNSADIERQWMKSIQAPVTYFILSNQNANEFKALVEQYLAGIDRKQALATMPYQPQAGHREKISTINLEPRAEIRAWSFNPVTWSPEAAVRVSVARNLADKYLKNTLRDQERGIYRMRLNSTLNDQTQRIETEISYTAAPERIDELWQKTQQTLRELPQYITDEDIQEQLKAFERNESSRTADIHTLQKRLMLSYQHYGDARYLTKVDQLSKAITLPEIRNMAGKLMSLDNQVLYITLPKTE